MTLRRFSGPSGLGERFAPEVVVGAADACSSCCLFRFASRCGGSSAPMPDMSSMNVVGIRCFGVDGEVKK